MLVDGDPDYNTKWEASDGVNHPGEPHWIILDFESEKTFDSIRLVKASQGSEDFGRNNLDANGFRFEVSSDKKSWVKIAEVTDDGDNDIYTGSFIPVTARYLKLVITQPEQDDKSNENQAVRLYDLKVFEYIAPAEHEEITEELFDVADEYVPFTNINVPNTSDFGFYILFLSSAAISAIVVISRIFSNRRSRLI